MLPPECELPLCLSGRINFNAVSQGVYNAVSHKLNFIRNYQPIYAIVRFSWVGIFAYCVISPYTPERIDLVHECKFILFDSIPVFIPGQNELSLIPRGRKDFPGSP